MSSSSNLFREFEGARDVPVLTSFVAAPEQDDERLAPAGRNTTGSQDLIDSHLRHATANGSHVAGMPSESRRMRAVMRARA